VAVVKNYAITVLIGVRVKYYNNDGHLAIEERGKFKVEEDVAPTIVVVRKLQCLGYLTVKIGMHPQCTYYTI